MILPEPRKDAIQQRGKAFASTVILAGLCYACLLLASVTFEKPSRQIFREVDLARFAPPVVAPEISNASPEAAESEESEAAEVEPVRRETSAQSLDQLDLSQLFPEDLSSALDPSVPSESARNVQADDSNAGEQIQVQSGGLQGLGGLDALDDVGGAPVPTSRGRTSRQAANTGGGIQIADGSNAVSPGDNGPAGAGTTRVVGENTRRAAVSEEADFDVARLSLDAFGSDYENLEVQALIAWMKRHPGEMPVGVRQLVRYRPAFLSSVTSFSLDGKRYELFLMCKEKLNEVHIVLVDGDEAIYLVDKSFQKLSTYLREGQVGRRADEGIVAVNSERNAPSDERSKEFYALFLSWWETAKKGG